MGIRGSTVDRITNMVRTTGVVGAGLVVIRFS